jgi:putative transcriptional regulator
MPTSVLMRRVACLILLVAAAASAAGYPLPEGVRRNLRIAKGEFLVASPVLMKDPRFVGSVILLLRHDDDGTIGVILNHSTKLTVHQLLPDLTGAEQMANPVFIGGPVTPRQIILLARTNRNLDGFDRIADHVSFSADGNAIKKWFAPEVQDKEDHPKESIRLFAGYSGWAPGQLEAEMTTGGWNILPADDKSVFDIAPTDLWDELNRRTTLQQAQGNCGFRNADCVRLLCRACSGGL